MNDKKHLIAHQISGQTLGVDIETWNTTELNGNVPFKMLSFGDIIPSGYTDISSITNWYSFGPSVCCPITGDSLEIEAIDIRYQIKELLTPSQLSGNTSGLTAQEIEIIKKYKIDNYFLLYDSFDKLVYDIDVQNPPVDINYNILGLHKKRYFNKGELYRTEYYKNYDFATNTYSNLVLHEQRTFYRINEMVYKRELDICWHLNTGISGDTKQTLKFYTQEESFAAGERRRRNCVTNLKINAVGLIMAVSGVSQIDAEQIGWAFLDEFQSQIAVYVEGAQEILLNAIGTTQNHPWMDGAPAFLGGATVRQYLYSELNIDYTINNTYV